MNIHSEAARLIRFHEGFRSKAYKDSLGVLTIGYGRNIGTRGITAEEADFLFANDYFTAFNDCIRLYPTYMKLAPARRAVLLNMAFNMGLKTLSGFKKMKAAIEREDWPTAAREMLNSRWAEQVGKRADTLAEMMLTSEWPKDVPF